MKLSMLNRIKKFTALNRDERRLFFEAFVTLGIMRFALLTLPFKHLVASLEQYKESVAAPPLTEKELNLAQNIGRAINRAANHTLWESACLVQALAAQKMLQKRNIPGVFYLGVMPGNRSQEPMQAHAWSQAGDIIVSGGQNLESFTIISAFIWGR